MQRTTVLIVAAILVVGGVYFFTGRDSAPTDAIVTDPATRPEADAPVATEESAETTMDDDTAMTAASETATPYTTAVTYLTPARTTHDMAVTLTIDENGVVTDASIVYDNGDGFSNSHQERFDGEFRSVVIGQALTDIELSTVAGASLTTAAFNEAVTKIVAERA